MGGIVAIAIKALQAIGPIAAALPEFKAFYDQVVGLVDEKDQVELKKAYTELLAENTGGHARLQEMLRKAQSQNPDAEVVARDLSGKPAPTNPEKS